MMVHKLLVLLLGVTFPCFCFSQTQSGAIRGKLLEQATKQPLTGATAKIAGTNLGATSDADGFFEIANVPEGRQTLTVSFVGFQEKTLPDVQIVRGKTFYIELELLENQVDLKEVTISTRRFENDPLMPVSTTTFSREEIFRNPGSGGDLLRAIGVMPGVSSSGGQYSAIAVRGQGVRDNAYFVDDIPVFELGHLEGNGAFNDPNGGRYSIFAPRVIDHAVFQGGGFGAQFGRKSASYLGLGVKEGNLASQVISGQFDLLGGTLIFDGHAGDIGVFATARYLDFRPAIKLIGIEDQGEPQLGDFLIKTTASLGKRHKISVLAMHNPEHYERNLDNARAAKKVESTFLADLDKSKTVAGVQLRSLTGSRSFWQNIVYWRSLGQEVFFGTSYPSFDAAFNLTDPENIPHESNLYFQKNAEREIGGRTIFTMNWSRVKLTAGVDVAQSKLDYRRSLRHPDTLFTFTKNDVRPAPDQFFTIVTSQLLDARFEKTAWNASAYVDLSLRFFKKLTLNPGLRFDRTGYTGENLVAPRLSGNFQMNAKNSLSFATGIFYQDPLLTDVADQSDQRKLVSERAEHYILGYKNYFAPDWKCTLEVWHKQYDHLVMRPYSGQVLLNNHGTGQGSGVDISVAKQFSKKWHGQAAVSLQRSKRDDHTMQGTYNADYSQPVQTTLLGSYQQGEHWIFSGKFRYATGLPKDDFIIHENVLDDASRLRFSQEITANNTARLADFISLDVRADYRKQLGKLSLTAFVDIVDILNRENQSGEFFQPLTGQTYFDGLAIFPTFGVKMEF